MHVDALESQDDDFFGFALGFEPGDSTSASADYLLIDWKKFDQNFDGSLAREGLAVSRVTGVPTDPFPNFWDHSGQVEELQRAVSLGSTGWANDEPYTFDVSISENSLVISVNGSEEFNLTGDFSDGRLAFYASAQAANFATDYGVSTSGALIGDFNVDGVVDCVDLDGYVGNIGELANGPLVALDIDGNGTVDASDAATHIMTLIETSSGFTGTFPGDLNCDGMVNVLGDAFVLVGSLGTSVTIYSEGDINFDGEVDVLGDAFILVGNLGKTNDPASN